jgi:hypothetical protein
MIFDPLGSLPLGGFPDTRVAAGGTPAVTTAWHTVDQIAVSFAALNQAEAWQGMGWVVRSSTNPLNYIKAGYLVITPVREEPEP